MRFMNSFWAGIRTPAVSLSGTEWAVWAWDRWRTRSLTSPEAFGSDFAVMAAYQAALGTPPTYAQFTGAVTAIRAGTQTVGGLFSSLINANYTAANLYQNLLNRQPLANEITAANTAGLAVMVPNADRIPGRSHDRRCEQ